MPLITTQRIHGRSLVVSPKESQIYLSGLIVSLIILESGCKPLVNSICEQLVYKESSIRLGTREMSGHGIVGVYCFVKGWHKVAGMAAVFRRRKVGSCIVVHK
jgi:hypothetical protein